MNNGNQHDMEELIGKYITEEATPEEIQRVQDWCGLSVENQKYFDHLNLLYEKSKLDDKTVFNADAAWDIVKQKITKQNVRTLTPVRVWRIAASLLLISLVSYLLYLQFPAGESMELASRDSVNVHNLADQTEITLNRNSSAKVAYNERKNTGTIKVIGEATLVMNQDKTIEWTVQADDLFIRDIGTTFNVKAYPGQTTIEVAVIEGSVQFYSETNTGIIVNAGEKGVYSKTTNDFSKTISEPNVTAYKTRAFTFDHTDLQSAVQLINSVYNSNIVLEGGIYNCKLSVEFTNEDLDTIVEIIAETLNLTITEKENTILLSGDGCR